MAADTMHLRELPLTGTQQGIWLADQVSDNGSLYTISHAIEIHGALDSQCLSASVQQAMSEADTVIARYEGGRQYLPPDPLAAAVPQPQTVDFSAHAQGRDQAFQQMWQDTREHRDIGGGQPLFRHIIFKLADNHWLWYQRYHHIMLDGFSFNALTRRVADIYRQKTAGKPVPATPFSAVDEVVAEYQHYRDSRLYLRDQEFWTDYCRDFPAPASLSLQGPAAAQGSGELRRYECELPSGTLARLQALAAECGHRTGLPDVLMAAAGAYLFRLTGQATQLLGVPFMRRLGSAAVTSVAPVVNVLPLRLTLQAEMNWPALAQQVQQEMKTIRRHQKYDAEQISRDLHRVGSDNRLYGAVVNYKHFDYRLDFAGSDGITHHLATGPVDDFEFGLLVHDTHIMLELRADAGRYTTPVLAQHAQRFCHFLSGWLDHPQQSLQSIPLLSAAEQQQLSRWQRGKSMPDTVAENNVVDIFWQQVQEKPQATALVTEESNGQRAELNFAQLGAKVAQLSRELQRRGASANTVVAVALPRSQQAVIAMLAVLDSGATFLPLDLDYPPQRMAMMCDDACPQLLLTSVGVTAALPADIPRLNLDAADVAEAVSRQPAQRLSVAERPAPGGDDIAYVIFTSGSTGRPKGVMNTHGALLNLLSSHCDSFYFPLRSQLAQRSPGRALRAAHTHSFSFDSSWLQIFWLLLGEELHVFADDTRRDAYEVVRQVHERHIDAMDLPPSFLAQLLNCGLMDHSEHQPALILIGGEACPASLWRQLNQYPDLIAHNLYGPTEYTVDTLRAELKASAQPLVGRPIANTAVYILDERLQPPPAGVVGELYISGKGLAAGYLARAELTAARFVADPFSSEPGARMYRSGDLVRWTEQGQVEFVGRGDDQVKIRGHRVEIGEVENALSLLPGVESTVVLAEAVNNSQRLLGYCVIPGLSAAEKAERSQQLLAQLHRRLPDYMVPARLLVLDEFVRNVSGKIDRKALPEAGLLRQNSAPQKAPCNQQEKDVCSSMAAVLQLDSIYPADDFFALGGDSINAIMLCTELRQRGWQIKPSQIFSGRSAAAIAAQLQAAERDDSPRAPTPAELPLTSDERLALQQRYDEFSAVAPLLPLQKGMLFETLLNPQGGNYNAYTRLQLSGAVDAGRLQQALNRLIARYPQLGGLFDSDTLAEPVLVLPPQHQLPEWQFSAHDLSHLQGRAQQEAFALLEDSMLSQQYSTRSFGGMLAAALVDLGRQQGENRFSLLLVIHHLVVDGWSTPLLLHDLLQAYESDHSLPPLTVDYPQLMMQLSRRDRQQAETLWQEALEGAQPTLVFAAEQVPEHAAVNEADMALSVAETRALNDKLRQQGLTLNVLMQALWARTLTSLTGQQDILFGTPVSGRSADLAGIQQQVGLFLNTLPVRVQLDPQQALWPQLGLLQQQHIVRLEQDATGLADIQRLCGGQRLFDTLLVVENYPDISLSQQTLTGRDGQPVSITDIHNRGYSHYPLALLVLPGEQLTLLAEDRGALPALGIDAGILLQRMMRQLRLALAETGDSALPLAQWPLMSAAEEQMLAAVNATAQPLSGRTLQSALQQQAQLSPHAPCVADAGQALTYAEARQRVQQLAARLQAEGVGGGDIVAVALPRSVNLTLAIWAVCEAGAAYLPLDLGYPDERLQFMLTDSGARVLITDTQNTERCAQLGADAAVTTLCAGQMDNSAALFTPVPVTPQHPAYLIYTSGTTGRPKGVLVSHEAIVNRLEWMQHEYPLTAADVVLQKTPCSFDVSVWEFFWSAMTGAQLVMAAADAHKDPQALVATIDHYRVTTLHFVPSMLAIFTATVRALYGEESGVCSSLRQVFCSGEALTKAQANAFNQRFAKGRISAPELHNLYGPTEAAVDVSYQPASGDLSAGGAGVPIGRPLWNTQLRVLDEQLRPVAVGARGELYLSGVQLALGYLGRPQLTFARFVADPYGPPGSRMYRTGDVVRWLGNGAVEYLGRADDQIKIRGQRIELGEIETRLLALPRVANAVVQAQELSAPSASGEDNRQLVAYLVMQGQATVDSAAIQQALAQELPPHMVPVAYMRLEQLPLSANGKLDRKALPPLQISAQRGQGSAAAGRPPARGLEQRLAAVFCQLLNVSRVAADDDFFALGGHSLLAMRLAAEIRRQLKRSLAVGQIMTSPTVAQLAQLLSEEGASPDNADAGFAPLIRLRAAMADDHGRTPAPLFCFYPGSGFAWQYSVLSRYLHPGRAIIGLQSPRPHGLIAASDSMEELLQQQLQIIRAEQPHGPYYLLGYSLGGTVAYGVAALLEQLGEDVRFLGLLDTYPAEVHDWNDPQGAEAALGAEQEQTRLLNDALATEAGVQAEKENQLGDWLAAQNNGRAEAEAEKEAMLAQIFANYRDAVRLLSASRTAAYGGRVTLFVAEQALPDYVQPEQCWAPYAGNTDVHRLAWASHENILAPESLQTLGPLLERLIAAAAAGSEPKAAAPEQAVS